MRIFDGINQNEIALMHEKGIFRNAIEDARRMRVMDAAAPQISNLNGLPGSILTQLNKEAVEVILRPRTAERLLGGKKKLLDWSSESLDIPFLERTGRTTPYSDNGTVMSSKTAITTVNIKHYRFSSLYTTGDLVEEQFARAGQSYRKMQFEGAMEACLVEFNRAAFYGYVDGSTNMLVKGIINDDSLSPFVVLPQTIEQLVTAKDWEGVIQVFVNAMANLTVQSGSNFDKDSVVRVGIPTKTYTILSGSMSPLGLSALDYVKKEFKNMEIIACPELENVVGNQSAMYFIGEIGLGGVPETSIIGYSEIGRTSAVVVDHNSYSQQIHFGSCGAVIYKPFLITRYLGV